MRHHNLSRRASAGHRTIAALLTVALAAGCTPADTLSEAPDRLRLTQPATPSTTDPAGIPDLTALDGRADLAARKAQPSWRLDTTGVDLAARTLARTLELTEDPGYPDRLRFATPATSGSPLAELEVSPDGSWYFFQDVGGFWFDCAGQGEDQLDCDLLDRTVTQLDARTAADRWFDRIGLAGTLGPPNIINDFGAYALAPLVVEGLTTDIMFAVGFTPTPSGLEVTYAYGTLARPIPDPRRFDTLSAADTARRAALQSGGWWRTTPDETSPQNGGKLTLPPASTSRQRVSITAASPALVYQPTVEGELWLLPGWTYTTDTGPFVALAITDNHIEPVTTPTLPEPEDGGQAQKLADELVGLSEADATALLDSNGITWRTVERDGEKFPATMDYNPARVNLTVEGGTVTAAKTG